MVATAAPSAMITPVAAAQLRSSRVSVRVPLRQSRALRAVSNRSARAVVKCQSVAAEVDQTTVDKCINAIRFLSIDGVEKANSGHPGLPMGCAPMSYVLWNETMKFNPKNPKWFNRDRFVLSAGHGSMLQYSLLHLAGFPNVTTEDLMSFRQWGSCTPGHPENFITPGVEVTTGPLGQGIANAVGLAAAEAHLAARYNKEDATIVDHYTYVILGDGCTQEGISNEAASLAGHWGLGKLIALYDDNKITIDGHTDISFTEDVMKRYEALGWHVIHVEDGNTDLDAIRKAIEEAKSVTDKPTMIKVSTLIGYGSPNKANSHAVHGAALGTDEVAATRENLKWDYEPFVVPEEAKAAFDHTERGAAEEAEWEAALADYTSKYPEEAAEFKQLISGELPEGWMEAIESVDYSPGNNEKASRIHSQTMLNVLAPVLPGLIGGSADLAPSNMTLMKMFGDFQKTSYGERNVRFGVREHAMGAIANGLGLHSSGLIAYCATFFIFTDYMRSAMRMAALSEIGTIFVMTHDSIGLGEDGPTHQPIEHLASFRAMPNMYMMRPGDGKETAGAYAVAVESRKTPTTLALSRQNLVNMEGTSIEGVKKGGYTIYESNPGETPDVIFLATGSELNMTLKAAEALAAEGKKTSCVSMVCWELFEDQSDEYKESVLPAAVTARIGVEAGSSFGWEKYIGAAGKMVSVDRFGASAPGPKLYEEFGFTTENILAVAKTL